MPQYQFSLSNFQKIRPRGQIDNADRGQAGVISASNFWKFACPVIARALLQILGEGPVRLKKNANVLASELETLPEELREALRAAVREAGQPPPVNRKLHLAIWCQKVMRKAQDEIDRLFGI